MGRRTSAPRKLTPKQQRFVDEYLVDLNATQAAVRAGYSARTANRMGSENLSKPVIQDAVQKALKRRAQRTEITADNVLREYARLAFADLTDVADADGDTVTVKSLADLPPEVTAAIAEVAQTATGIRVKFHSKTQALESLARHLGLFNDKLTLAGRLRVEVDQQEADAVSAKVRAMAGMATDGDGDRDGPA
ncbi:MAG: terminase small subunit [Chloroflexi bacterium]|nr:terminase small subunit [Chloroflexota bacterium]